MRNRLHLATRVASTERLAPAARRELLQLIGAAMREGRSWLLGPVAPEVRASAVLAQRGDVLNIHRDTLEALLARLNRKAA